MFALLSALSVVVEAMPEDVVKSLRDIVEETAEEPTKEEPKEPEKQWGSCYQSMRP